MDSARLPEEDEVGLVPVLVDVGVDPVVVELLLPSPLSLNLETIKSTASSVYLAR